MDSSSTAGFSQHLSTSEEIRGEPAGEPAGTGGVDKAGWDSKEHLEGDVSESVTLTESGGGLTAGVEVKAAAAPQDIRTEPRAETGRDAGVISGPLSSSFKDMAEVDGVEAGIEVPGETPDGMKVEAARTVPPQPGIGNHSPKDAFKIDLRNGEARVAGGGNRADVSDVAGASPVDKKQPRGYGRPEEVKGLLEFLGVKASEKDVQGEFQFRTGEHPSNLSSLEASVGQARLNTALRKHASEQKIAPEKEPVFDEVDGVDAGIEDGLLIKSGVGEPYLSASFDSAKAPLFTEARTAAQKDNHGSRFAEYGKAGAGNGPISNVDADEVMHGVVKEAAPSTGHARLRQTGEGLFLQLDNGVRLSLAQGGREARVKLHPASLGELRIRIRVDDDGGVKTRITVDNLMVKSVLEADAVRLREIFSQHGLTLDKYTIELGSGWSQAAAHGDRQFSDFGDGGRPDASSLKPMHRDVPEQPVRLLQGINTASRGSGIDIFA